MVILEEIISKYSQYGLTNSNQQGGLILPFNKALDFVSTCNENDFAIIGIEGFEVGENYIKPRIDMIADFSSLAKKTWDDYKQSSFLASKEFLEFYKEEKNVGFEFLVVSKQEYENKVSRL